MQKIEIFNETLNTIMSKYAFTNWKDVFGNYELFTEVSDIISSKGIDINSDNEYLSWVLDLAREL